MGEIMNSDQPRSDRVTESNSVDSNWFVSWVAELEKLLRDRDWASAKLVFKWLRDVGCDAEWIIQLLAACTHSDPNIRNPLALQTKIHIRNFLRLLPQFEMRASKTQQVFQALNAEPYAEHFPPFPTAIFRVEFPVVHTTAGGYLKHPGLGIPCLKKSFNARKIPSDLLLVALCTYIRRIIGRPSYPQIALLLDAGHAAHKQNKEVDPESLRKTVKRFETSRPELFHALAELSPGH